MNTSYIKNQSNCWRIINSNCIKYIDSVYIDDIEKYNLVDVETIFLKTFLNNYNYDNFPDAYWSNYQDGNAIRFLEDLKQIQHLFNYNLQIVHFLVK